MFRHQQQLSPEGQVRSVQTLTLSPPLPAPLTEADARVAGDDYFHGFLGRLARPLLQVARRADGGVTVRALYGRTLLRFGPPAVVHLEGAIAVRYPIETGAVVQREGEGQGYLGVRLSPGELALEVDGYYARIPGRRGALLRRWFYLASQNSLHVLIAWLFLRRLATKLGQRGG